MAEEQNRKEINKALAKPLALTAGILGLVQGLAWTIFAVLCICGYDGSIQLDATNKTNMEYYEIIFELFLNADNNLVADVIIKPEDFLIFNCFYLFFSIVWTLVSGTVVWTMIHNKWNFSKSLFGAWSVTAILISIVDIVLMGLLAADYVTMKNAGFVTEILVSYGIVMSLAARGFVLWIINVVFAGIMMRLTINIILRENKRSTIPIIHGYETNDNTNPPWFNNSVKDFWANPQRTSDGYDNQVFERSPSFIASPLQNGTPNNVPSNNIYSASPNNAYSAYTNNTRAPTFPPNNRPTSFSEAIAQKTATIGKNKGQRSPPNHVRPPVIPDPDYTPPNSPNALKSVLRAKSNYNQPVY